MEWFQTMLRLPAKRRGFHLITHGVQEALPEIAKLEVGMLHLFLQHTSASLSINENADPDVRRDLEQWSSAAMPESFPFRHTAEGPDDMPAHVKATVFGTTLSIPIRQGRLALGTWQGIYLGEHRDDGGERTVCLTAYGRGRN